MAEAGVGYEALDAIAVTLGPGGFTGVRIGLATARALALACARPVIGISNFEAVAAAVPESERRGRSLAVLIDAKRSDLYAQAFSAEPAALTEQRALAPEALTEQRALAPEELTEQRALAPEALHGFLPPGPLILAGDAAAALTALGFSVAGWSATEKNLDGIESFHVADRLTPFLQRTDILVCLLPLTAKTEDIIDARALAALPRGAYLINAARGGHVDEDALLEALESGHLAGATLDVFKTEPLPADHPFWGAPSLTITPHIASLTVPASAAAEIAANIARILDGKAPRHAVDPARGD